MNISVFASPKLVTEIFLKYVILIKSFHQSIGNDLINHTTATHSVSIETMLSDEVLGLAYAWSCKQRMNRSHNNSIWDLRFNWKLEKERLKSQVKKNTYTLSPLRRYVINGESVASWDALDSILLKALSITLQSLFSNQAYPDCTHLKEGGGIHRALQHVNDNKACYQHILKSDAYQYYDSMDHDVLLDALKEKISCPGLLRLVTQYCERVEIRDGHYFHFTRGIPKGCPLSPLMAALYLKPLDDVLSRYGCYVRFMDDWVIMVKTKHQLRKVIKLTHQILNKLKLKMHPDKTFIGRIKKGFDFLGVYCGDIPKISEVTHEKHRAKLAQRYAQGASEACIGAYIERWTSWCISVLRSCCGGTKTFYQSVEALRSQCKQPPDIHQEHVYEGHQNTTCRGRTFVCA